MKIILTVLLSFVLLGCEVQTQVTVTDPQTGKKSEAVKEKPQHEYIIDNSGITYQVFEFWSKSKGMNCIVIRHSNYLKDLQMECM